jgi:hypothetical protein
MAQPLFQTEKVVSPEVEAEAKDLYEYHPWDAKQTEAGNNVREALIHAHLTIIANVPPGPDRTVAIRKVREARMDANSGITNGGRY